MTVYNKSNPTDKEIKECTGDYFGCEICSHAEKCLSIKLAKLHKLDRKSPRTKYISNAGV